MHEKKPIRFISKERTLFFATLKKRVDSYFAENNLPKTANTAMVVKTIVLLGGYVVPFALLLLLQPPAAISVGLWFIMGLGLAGAGMSIMHDANHGAYSRSEKVNSLIGHTLTLLGGSTFNWKIQHNLLHHNYTNITHVDEDINDKLLLKLSPHNNHLLRPFHRLQFVYAFFLYGLSTLYWVAYKDFPQFFRYIKKGINTDSKAQNTMRMTGMIAHRLLYFFIFLAMPTLFFGIPFYQVLGGFLLMHFVAGLVLTAVFQLAHTVEETTHPLPSGEGIIENDWAVHQMETTVNFSPDNKWLSWYVGGLNYQVEHHLFPRVCHVHYPKIAAIVKRTAAEYGVPYLQNRSFFAALKSHIKALQRFGKWPHISQAIM